MGSPPLAKPGRLSQRTSIALAWRRGGNWPELRSTAALAGGDGVCSSVAGETRAAMSGGFAAALESGDLAAVRAFPKADLHNHGVLCGDRQFLREATGVDVAPLAAPIGSMAEMGAWVDANIGPLLY